MRSTLSGFGEGLLGTGRKRNDVVLLHADMVDAEVITPFPLSSRRGPSTAGSLNRTW